MWLDRFLLLTIIVVNDILNFYTLGIGKSTLANEICLNWAMDKVGSLSMDYDLVILIRLRTVQERTLQEVMIEAVGSQAAYDELLTKCHGEKCLIILEGLDEISVDWHKKDMFYKLIKTTTYLSYANVLVTSRPHACLNLYVDVKDHVRTIEIVGFKKSHIKEYAESNLQNLNSAERFMEQVNSNPRISSLCYVPLNLKMVLECFKYNNDTIHTNLTELYQSFIISKVNEHINQKKARIILKSDPNYINNLSSVLNDLPCVLSKEALEILFLLSKLAYNSYFHWSDKSDRNPKIVYTSKDLDQCNIADLRNDACGLLKATNTMFATSNTPVYSFNHLSVQEYFCALYIALLPEVEQLQLLKDHIHDYPHMWPFYAGITKLRSCSVAHHLCQFLLLNKQVDSSTLVYCDHTMAYYGKNVKVSVALHSFYEAHVLSDVCQDQLVSLFICVHYLNPLDYMSISYLLSAAPITCLHLRNCGVGDLEAEMLFARCTDLVPTLKVVDLNNNNISHKGIKFVAMITKSTNLTHISVARNPVGTCYPKGEKDDNNIDLFSLIQLNVCCTGMTTIGACTLSEYLTTSLQSLEICHNNITDDGLAGILNNVCSTLVRLIASKCKLTHNGAVIISKTLISHEALKHLEISDNPIGDDGISAISDSLHINKSLIQLVAFNCEFHSKGAKSIAKMLQANKTLKYLDISKNQIGDDGTAAVALSIQANTTLILLNISGCGFCNQGAKTIAEMLQVNKTLKILDISENYIEDDDEMSALACKIKANTTLIKLNITYPYSIRHKCRFSNNTLRFDISVASMSDKLSYEHARYIPYEEIDFEGN